MAKFDACVFDVDTVEMITPLRVVAAEKEPRAATKRCRQRRSELVVFERAGSRARERQDEPVEYLYSHILKAVRR